MTFFNQSLCQINSQDISSLWIVFLIILFYWCCPFQSFSQLSVDSEPIDSEEERRVHLWLIAEPQKFRYFSFLWARWPASSNRATLLFLKWNLFLAVTPSTNLEPIENRDLKGGSNDKHQRMKKSLLIFIQLYERIWTYFHFLMLKI